MREHPVYEIEKHLRELEEHLRLRCRRHVDGAVARRPDELMAARDHVQEIRLLVKDVIPWEREKEAADIKRGPRKDPFAQE